MNNKKDYYEVLGIPKKASEDEIKKAYRKMAREHHPDMVKDGDKKAAEERFKEINEAYQVLSDPDKRNLYDQVGHAANFSGGGGQQGGPGFGQGGAGGQWGPFSYSYSSSGAGAGEFDPFDIFEEFFGFRGFGGQRRPRKGKNLYYEIRIDFADAVHGAEKEIKGESGKVSIKIPQGVRDGTELRFPGKGMPGPDGAPNGDLFITLRVITPKEFQRAGDNLGVALEIDFVQATLGDQVEIPIIDINKPSGIGKTKLKIPQGTQPMTQFRVRNKGMPKLRGTGQGDIIVQVFVTIPKKLSREQRKVLEKYKSTI